MTAKGHFRSLGIIHAFLLITLSAAAIVSFYLHGQRTEGEDPQVADETTTSLLLVACIIIGIVVIIAADIIYKGRVKKINDNENQDYDHKLSSFKSAVIVEWIWLLFANVGSLWCYYLTGNNVILVIFIVLWIVFFFNMPTRKKLVKDVDFNQQEKMKIFEQSEIAT